MPSHTHDTSPGNATDRQYAGALAKAPFPVIETDAALRIVSWNQGAARLFGYLQDEALGKGIVELLPADIDAAVWQRLLQEEGVTQTSTHTGKGGSRVVCAWSCQALRDEQRGTYGALWFGHDMTAHRALEEEHRPLARMIAVLEDNLPLILWRTNKTMTIEYSAGKALAGAGLKRGELVGANIRDMYDSFIIAAFDVAMAGEPNHLVHETLNVHWETWMLPLREEQGAVAGVLGVSLDVSQQKRIEVELRAKLAEIERQQSVIRSLSTPIIQVWEGVLTLPMIGVIDSTRTAYVMDTLLETVSRTRARFAILDLTGVEAVDTKTASYLLDIVRALRLLGAEGIIAGIRPSVAQTVVSLGVDLANIATLSNLQAALRHCLVQMQAPAGAR